MNQLGKSNSLVHTCLNTSVPGKSPAMMQRREVDQLCSLCGFLGNLESHIRQEHGKEGDNFSISSEKTGTTCTIIDNPGSYIGSPHKINADGSHKQQEKIINDSAQLSATQNSEVVRIMGSFDIIPEYDEFNFPIGLDVWLI